jgi:hypothetical protein
MRRTILLFLFAALSSLSLYSQIGKRASFFELQFGAGPVFMKTDIGNLGYGGILEVTGKYRLHQHIALKASLGGGLGMGTDQGSDNEARGMSYYTILVELTGQIEFYILKEGRGYGKGGNIGYKPRVRPYLYAGGGPLLFYPTHTHDNAEPLPDFNNYTVIMMGGVGFLYRVNADLFWGMQVGGRFSTTDFLDGYSPESSVANDTYYTAKILLVHRF